MVSTRLAPELIHPEDAAVYRMNQGSLIPNGPTKMATENRIFLLHEKNCIQMNLHLGFVGQPELPPMLGFKKLTVITTDPSAISI